MGIIGQPMSLLSARVWDRLRSVVGCVRADWTLTTAVVAARRSAATTAVPADQLLQPQRAPAVTSQGAWSADDEDDGGEFQRSTTTTPAGLDSSLRWRASWLRRTWSVPARHSGDDSRRPAAALTDAAASPLSTRREHFQQRFRCSRLRWTARQTWTRPTQPTSEDKQFHVIPYICP